MSTARERFATVVRNEPVDVVTALLLMSAEAGFDPDPIPVLAEFDRLAGRVRTQLEAGLGATQAMQSVMATEGFFGNRQNYAQLRSSVLQEVLRRRSGLPILLSVVWVEVARRLDVPAHCIGAPGHVLAAVDGVVVDPFAGGLVAVHPTGARDAGDFGPPLAGGQLLLRVLANLRQLATDSGDSHLGLWSVELSLLVPSHPLDLRRERGLLLVRRGDFLGGARELEEFALVAPGPADEEALRAAKMARARLN